MQRILIVLVVGILSVGCGGSKEKAAPKSQAKVDVMPKVEAKGEVKELTIEEKVVGEYEFINTHGYTFKHVFLDNGIYKYYINGKKLKRESKWSISKGEIHVFRSGYIQVMRTNKDKSINSIATIRDGKRTDFPKESQSTSKKIK